MMERMLQQCSDCEVNVEKKQVEAKEFAKAGKRLSERAESSFADSAISTSRDDDHGHIRDENISFVTAKTQAI